MFRALVLSIESVTFAILALALPGQQVFLAFLCLFYTTTAFVLYQANLEVEDK